VEYGSSILLSFTSLTVLSAKQNIFALKLIFSNPFIYKLKKTDPNTVLCVTL